MNGQRTTSAIGIGIVLGGLFALIVSSGLMKRTIAQEPPTPDLPPVVTAEAPVVGSPTSAEAPALVPPGGPLDAAQDPGLKNSNPEGFIYDPSGRRDPFFAPNRLTPPPPSALPTTHPPGESPDQRTEAPASGDPLLSFPLTDYKLIGVLWEVRDPKAMVRAPNDQVYTIRLKTKLGRESGVVSAIREREIVVVIPDPTGDYKNGEARALRLGN